MRGKSSLISTLLFLFTCAYGYSQETNPSKLLSTQCIDDGWKFVWGQLLTPARYLNDTVKEKPIQVPGSWNDSGYGDTGFGTYRVTVQLPEKVINHSILLPQINSAAKVWLNGKLMDELGVCNPDRTKYRPEFRGLLIAIPDDTTTIELVLQVINYDYSRGGIIGEPIIGPTSSLLRPINTQKGIENIFAGSLIAMFFYQITLFGLFQRGKPYLYIALICLFVALRAVLTSRGSYLVPDLFPGISVAVWKKIEFFVVYAVTAIFPHYVYSLFPAHANKKILQGFVGTGIILCAVVVCTPYQIYGQLLNVFHIALIGGFIYSIMIISRAWRAGNPDARFILYGIMASIPFIFLEIVQNSRTVNLRFSLPYLVEMGVLIFLLFQVFLLANQFSKAHRKLETVNVDLEAKVTARTAELRKENYVREKLLSVVSHDIKSPLNSLQGILNIYHKGGLTGEEMKSFMGRISENLASTINLVDNILLWVTNQLKGVQVSNTSVDLYELVEEHFEIFKSIASNKNIGLVNEGLPMLVKTDRQILSFVLRNLIANAIKFSYEKGCIKIFYEQEVSGFRLMVDDNGKGMPEEFVGSLFHVKSTVSTAGTNNEKGTGLGLSLCYDYLKYIQGEISVRSVPGKGTTFTIRVPLPL